MAASAHAHPQTHLRICARARACGRVPARASACARTCVAAFGCEDETEAVSPRARARAPAHVPAKVPYERACKSAL
eukprot:6200570-Pleurochrysis_carterae.AAC.2